MTRALKSPPPHQLGRAGTPARATVELEDAGDSPILRGYREVHEQFPGAVVLVRLGDFYEMFGADAEAGSRILGIALTGRGFGNAGRVPMCGVPQQSLTQHLRRLLDAGRQVVVWDQVGAAEAGKLVRREVTRVLSPGMVVEDALLDATAVRRCVALVEIHGRTGVAALDPSTGDMQVLEVDAPMASPAVVDECAALSPAELVFADGDEPPALLGRTAARSVLPLAFFDLQSADRRLREACGTSVLAALDLDDAPVARRAAGALLAYCDRSRIALAPALLRITVRRPGDRMRLDPQTRRNLELSRPLGGDGPSLVSLCDRTCTAMGGRLLRTRLQEPLTVEAPLQARLDAVQDFVDHDDACVRARDALRHVADLERLTARCVQGIATPRDLGLIRDTLGRLSDVHGALEGLAAGELVSLRARCSEPPGLRERLAALLVDSPPASAREGGSIRAGADPELDSLLAASSDARTFIAGLEDAERRRTGIRSLRVGYNRVFGYYIEVPNAHGASVPDSYVRKQTLVGAERYITADLKEHESIVLHARERSVAREVELLEGAAALVAGEATALLACAGALAELDVAQSLARAAVEHRWTRPALDGSADLEVEDGRHPLVEASLGPGRFVPNDCRLGSEQRILVLTGPNMAGKSTYLRQVASIVLLAQVGSFVPARRARVGLCDRIFTRVGAHDDLSGGMSTFMVEMSETAAILRQASGRSLVVLDEIGRGTSTYDGLSIAQAVVEHIHDAPHLSCRTLFATHFHELTALAGRLPRVVNARIEVVEEGDHVTFLHRIAPGGADRSYGVHVAKLAGVPSSVLLRARQILAELQRVRPLAPADGAGGSADQMALPIPVERAPGVVEELAGLDVDTLTPIAALNKLADLHRQARG